MSNFTVPIQERDTTPLQPYQPIAANTQMVTPFAGTETAPLTAIEKMVAQHAEIVKKKTDQLFEAKSSNDISSVVNEASAKVVAARGENSYVVADQMQKQMQDKIGKLRSQVPAEYADRFDETASKGITQANKVFQGHQYLEQGMVRDSVFKARTSSVTETTASQVYDKQAFDSGIKTLNRVTEQYVRQRMGGDPDLKVEPSAEIKDVIAAQKNAAGSKLILQAIQGLAAREDIPTAERIVSDYGHMLTSPDRTAVDKLIAKGRGNQNSTIAKSLMEDAFAASHNPVVQMEYIRKHAPNGDIYKEASSMFENQTNFNETQRKRGIEAAHARAQEEIRKSNGDPAVVAKVLKGLPLEDKDKILAYAKDVSVGKDVVRDNREYANLRDMYEHNPSEFAKINLQSKTHVLPQEDIQAFQAKQDEIRTPSINKLNSGTVDDITKRVISTEVGTVFGYQDEGYLQNKAIIQSQADKVFFELQKSMGDRVSPAEFRQAFEKELILRTRKVTTETPGIFKRFGQSVLEQGSFGIYKPSPVKTTTTIEPPKALTPEQGGYNYKATGQLDRYNPILVESVTNDLTKALLREPTPDEVAQKIKDMEFRLSQRNKNI